MNISALINALQTIALQSPEGYQTPVVLWLTEPEPKPAERLKLSTATQGVVDQRVVATLTANGKFSL